MSCKVRPSNRTQIIQAIKVIAGGTVVFSGVCLYKGDEKFYRNFLLPCLRFVDPETAHSLAVKAAEYRLVPKLPKPKADLQTRVFGLTFPSPVGLAAGFDKNGEAVPGLFDLGLGSVEIGSVTPLPQDGNPKPRIFRLLQDDAVINRCGFNSAGHDVVLYNLQESGMDDPAKRPAPLGINLGKNKTSEDATNDYVQGVKFFGPVADYLVINVSSPNTPGLRNLQAKQALSSLLSAVLDARDSLKRRVPLLLKISPDSCHEELREIAEVCLEKQVDGVIVSNTTVSRPASLRSPEQAEDGGLSGAPLKEKSLHTLRDFYQLTGGRIPLIGVGGISSGQDAFERIRAGASLVQLYTAMTYGGPGVVNRIHRELEEILREHGFSSIKEAVGSENQAKEKY